MRLPRPPRPKPPKTPFDHRLAGDRLTLRSPALAVLGIALLAGAAVLGGLLVHDGETAAAADLSRVEPGQAVALKGQPEPFVLAKPSAARAWRAVLPLLDNHTYTLSDAGGSVVVLLTSPDAAPEGTVLAEGQVRYVAPHPDGPGRLLVVVDVHDWRSPLVFR